MSVEEVIELIRAMDADGRRRVMAVIESLDSPEVPLRPDGDTVRRGDAAWERLLAGYGSAPGKHLSANIDEAVDTP